MMSADRTQAGAAAGIFSTLRSVGGAVGVQVAFSLLDGTLHPGAGVVAAYFGLIAFWLISLVCALFTARRVRFAGETAG
jgi:hypothetical protein